jgi:lipopolysaccharide/colanic/teichoic acid biosynthesis glycosyltransferase
MVGRPRRRPYLAAKLAAEWLFALALLVLVAPILATLAILVKLTSPGPVFYSQVRLGKDGREYRVFKLRTMLHDCEAETGAVWAVQDDPRTTPIGRFLRDTHLDEIPQLWNVLRGEMSLIGPRPERPEIAVHLERVMPTYRQRLQARPGMTGLAQMRLSADSDVDGARRKLSHDLYYVRHLGPALDLQLVLATILYMAARLAKSSSELLIRIHGRRADREQHVALAAGEQGALELQLRLTDVARRTAASAAQSTEEVKAA